jgi:hypothetical protein
MVSMMSEGRPRTDAFRADGALRRSWLELALAGHGWERSSGETAVNGPMGQSPVLEIDFCI